MIASITLFSALGMSTLIAIGIGCAIGDIRKGIHPFTGKEIGK